MNIDQEISAFCENVKKLRSKNGLTQDEMSKMLGISLEELSELEVGIIPKKLDVSLLFKIYDVFGIHPKEMFAKR